MDMVVEALKQHEKELILGNNAELVFIQSSKGETIGKIVPKKINF